MTQIFAHIKPMLDFWHLLDQNGFEKLYNENQELM
jgi:hypothetical protein